MHTTQAFDKVRRSVSNYRASVLGWGTRHRGAVSRVGIARRHGAGQRRGAAQARRHRSDARRPHDERRLQADLRAPERLCFLQGRDAHAGTRARRGHTAQQCRGVAVVAAVTSEAQRPVLI
eukprot:scaffold96198_cov69-Phaeocystis_antarctica.AAC.4